MLLMCVQFTWHKTTFVRQNVRWLQFLCAPDTDKTEGTVFITCMSYQASSSIHKNHFYTKKAYFTSSFSSLVEAHRIRYGAATMPSSVHVLQNLFNK